MSKPEPSAGGGAELRNIWPTLARQIQQTANRYQVTIVLVGSRASGTAGSLSDFDYVIDASHRIRASAKYFLPRGPRIGDRSGIDIFSGPLDTTRPHIIFARQSANAGHAEENHEDDHR